MSNLNPRYNLNRGYYNFFFARENNLFTSFNNKLPGSKNKVCGITISALCGLNS